jgi:hypothetical protein
MSRIVKYVSILLCCLLTSACVGNISVRSEFEKSVKDYNRMLRWREIENAGLIFMDAEQREAFLTTAEKIRKRGITITDYRVLYSEFFPEKNAGNAAVEFDYYIMPSNRIKTLTYKQDWVYRNVSKKENSKDMVWKLKSGLPDFD